MTVPIPTVEDFTCTPKPEDDLDGFRAWRNFGGLTVDEAYQKFCEESQMYQEDFMWMGDRAFVFYFPVIDQYIREEEPIFEFDEVTHILGHCIGMHVSEDHVLVRSLYDQIVKLCHFVLQGVKNLRSDEDRDWSPREIETVWKSLLESTLCLMREEQS